MRSCSCEMQSLPVCRKAKGKNPCSKHAMPPKIMRDCKAHGHAQVLEVGLADRGRVIP